MVSAGAIRQNRGAATREARVLRGRLWLGAAVGVVSLATYGFLHSRNAASGRAPAAASARPANAVVTSAPPLVVTERHAASTFGAASVRSLHDEATSLSAATDEPPEREPSAEDYVRAVQAERRDESWATATTRQLDDDLREKAARLSFRVRTIDCRRASCYAELAFASLKAAREGFKLALGLPNQPNCPLRLLFPTDGDEDAPVLGVMIVDCRELRSREERVSAPGAAR